MNTPLITTLTGQNSYLLQQQLKALTSAFVQENGDMSLEQLDGEESAFNRIREALQSLPFLASKKLVLLRSPSANKQFAENAEVLLRELPETTHVIIVEPKLDKRTSYYKYLHKHSNFHEFSELDEFATGKWITGLVAAAGGTISLPDVRYLIERVGPHQRLLSNEISKLLTYNLAVTKVTIDLLVEPTPQNSIFDLIDAAFGGRLERALQLYEQQRRLNVEPQQIMAMIAWQLHVLAIVKAAGQKDPSIIAKDAKLNPYVIRKSIGIANSIALSELKALLHETVDLDAQLKSQNIDADEAIRNLIVRIASPQ